jgi:hypothetical protein
MKIWPQLLELPQPPRRIEGYDISHIQGSDAVASQVVFVDGLPAKQHYRKYRIQSSSIRAGHSDDFMAMAEIMRRRFRRWSQAKAEGADLGQLRRSTDTALHTGGLGDWPDLVMIDGGKGQLSAVMEALRELDLHEELVVCSLAKQREEVFLPGASQPLESEPDQLGLLLLRRLRDEAHRFAVSFHRQQRGERMKRSRLSEIPGLGPKRVKDLLAHFRSIDAIQPETYLWFKTLHIVGVVVWFAGLFYLVRLFIYHAEADQLDPDLRQAFQTQYGLMERRLANIITTPGMVVTVAMAVGLAHPPTRLAAPGLDARQAGFRGCSACLSRLLLPADGPVAARGPAAGVRASCGPSTSFPPCCWWWW